MKSFIIHEVSLYVCIYGTRVYTAEKEIKQNRKSVCDVYMI